VVPGSKKYKIPDSEVENRPFDVVPELCSWGCLQLCRSGESPALLCNPVPCPEEATWLCHVAVRDSIMKIGSRSSVGPFVNDGEGWSVQRA
jgi:hypothetical protein